MRLVIESLSDTAFGLNVRPVVRRTPARHVDRRTASKVQCRSLPITMMTVDVCMNLYQSVGDRIVIRIKKVW